MKVQVLQEDLSKILNISSRFVNTKATLPILGNLLLIAQKTKLKISATNLEMSINTSIGAKVEKEGSVTVPARTFSEIISNLNQGQVDLSVDKEKLTISSQGFLSLLPTTPPNDFPSTPESLNTKKAFSMATSQLQEILSKVLFSASLDEGRPILTGVLFVFKDKELSLVASDGFRLSQKKINLGKKVEEKRIVIPKPFLLEFAKIAKEQDSVLFELRESENQAVIKIGETYLATRLIDGIFPDFEKIIPTSPGISVSVDKNDLARAIKLASVFAREESGVIKMEVGEGYLKISSESKQVGLESSKIEAKVEGGTLNILYNFKFIEEFLNVTQADDVQIKLTDATSPAIFVDPKDPDFLHLIMPVRVQS